MTILCVELRTIVADQADCFRMSSSIKKFPHEFKLHIHSLEKLRLKLDCFVPTVNLIEVSKFTKPTVNSI